MSASNSSLTKRLFTSLILVLVSLYTIFLSPIWLFVLVVECFVLAGVWEYFTLAEKKGFILNRYLGLFFSFLFPLAYLISAESIIFMVATLCIFLFNFHRRLKDQALVSTSLTLFGMVYVAFFMSFLTKLRLLEHGSFWVFYAIASAKIGDAAAYFIGKKFGRNKYIVHISPNKSIEGAIGGFCATVIASLCSKIYLSSVPLYWLLILGILVGIVSQMGDLAESLIKREVGVKDSGAWPGLGGALDVLDSLLFVIPLVYYFALVFMNGLVS